MLKAENLVLLRAAYDLHIIDHEKDGQNHFRLVKQSNGWILTRKATVTLP